jgi:hypothetical protein
MSEIGNWHCDKHDLDLSYDKDCPACAAQRMADRQRVKYDANNIVPPKPIVASTVSAAEQKTGGSVDYYKCHVADPIDPNAKPYTAESIDIIEALGMTFAEGEAFKAIWRTCTGRMGGAVKADNKALYNAEKVEFFGARMVRAAKRSEADGS